MPAHESERGEQRERSRPQSPSRPRRIIPVPMSELLAACAAADAVSTPPAEDDRTTSATTPESGTVRGGEPEAGPGAEAA